MVASLMAAPFWSVTLPVISALFDCARDADAQAASSKATQPARKKSLTLLPSVVMTNLCS
jgi:hypothetical protein